MSEKEEYVKRKINAITTNLDAYYRCGFAGIHKIEEETKVIGAGYYNNITLLVYRCYDINNNLLVEIESNSGLTIGFDVEENKQETNPIEANQSF